jgi:hypothetical protein
LTPCLQSHFRSQDDLLVENLRPMLSEAAQLVSASALTPEIEGWMAHIWGNRAAARRLFARPAASRLTEALTEEIASHLDGGGTGRQARLVAHQIAGAMMGLLKAWVAGRAPASPAEMARQLWTGARALAGTLSGHEGIS